MSDTEEVIIKRAPKAKAAEPIISSAPSVPSPPPKNPNPEAARLKMKEKRERLKKEKDNYIIEEAKKRLAIETEKKIKADALAKEQEALAKQQEEEKRNADPTYIMMKRMEEMMAMMQSAKAPAPAPEPVKAKAKPKPKKKVVEEEEEEPEEKPKRKPRVAKEVVESTTTGSSALRKPTGFADKPNKSPGLPKPRKKVVYLQPERQQSETNQFVGYDVAPPAEPIQYHSSSGLLSALMSRRNMNSFYQ